MAAGNVISGNNSNGVYVEFSINNSVAGNRIGTNAAGTAVIGNSGDGVQVFGSTATIIGGVMADARNIISGNVQGISISGSATSGTVIQGNYIGTDVNGNTDLGNTVEGVWVVFASNTTIGGTAAGAGNVISGNNANGIHVQGNATTTIQGNFIGTNTAGTAAVGNSQAGVHIESANNIIGGSTSGASNTIAFNAGPGVAISSGTGNSLWRNSIFSNGGLGIDLGNNGVTANDLGDGDSGANNFQNFPVLSSSSPLMSDGTEVNGTLNSTPNTTFTLEFFYSPTADPSGFGEGKTYFGTAFVTINASGNVSFSFVFGGTTVPVGQFVTATATDPSGNTSEFSQAIQVQPSNRAPVAANGTLTTAEDTGATGTLVATDVDSASLTYIIVSQANAHGTVTITNPATGAFSYAPAANYNGPASFTFKANDGFLDSNTATVTITVTAVNDAPVIDTLTATSVAENGTAHLAGTYHDNDVLDAHTLTVNWGEGAPQTVTVTGGSFDIAHQYLDDNPTATASDTYTITANLMDDQTAFEYATADSSWGGHLNVDSQQFVGARFELASTVTTSEIGGFFFGTGTIFGAVVRLSGPSDFPDSLDLSTADVVGAALIDLTQHPGADHGAPLANAPLAVTLTPGWYALVYGSSVFGATGVGHAPMNNPEIGSPSVFYSSNQVSMAYFEGGFSGAVFFILSQAPTGNVATTSIHVNNVAPQIDSLSATSVNENGTVHLTGAYHDVGMLDTHTLTINWGEGASQTVAVSGGTFDITHQYLDDNPTGTASDMYTIGATLIDDDTGTGTRSTTATVTNVASTVGTIMAQVDPVAVTTLITASANFTDPGIQDTHTAVWDWGDGSTSAGTVYETNGLGSVSGSHAYSVAGVYTVTLTVTDDDTGAGMSTFQYVVVYDPSAGFVTGGGWINSPAGAYFANPALIGKANFGFNSKYQNGNNVPTGNTEFQFKVANFNFKSTSYEWLVISGAKARFRGVGTVNGTGSYGFELTAWDGQAPGGGGTDRFRIKIWLGNQGNGVVYDNMMGAADGADPTTALGGGSIVIHKNPQALLASGGAAVGKAGGTLSQESLNHAVDQAINYWRTTGVDSEAVSNLQQIHVEVADLSDDALGIASETNYVRIDRDAAGYGWQLYSLSATNPSVTGGMDLLSVVAHELGHKLGLEHSHGDGDLMAPTLQVGVRSLFGNFGQTMAFLASNWDISDSLRSDVTRLSSRNAHRLPKEDMEEIKARDQLFASFDTGPAKLGLRKAVIEDEFVSDMGTILDSDDENLLGDDFMRAITLAQLTKRSQ